MALVHCIDCGANISSDAKDCPKCQSKFPFGVHCQVCKDGPLSTKIDLVWRDSPATSKHTRKYGRFFYHETCVRSLVVPKEHLRCPECRNRVTWPSLEQAMEGVQALSCNECGKTWNIQQQWKDYIIEDFSVCAGCLLPIYAFVKQEITWSIPYSSYMAPYHPACVPANVRKAQDEVQRRHEAERLREERNKRPFWRRFLD